MSGGTKYDSEKLRYDLLDWDFIDEMVRILMAGAKEYGYENWQAVPQGRRRYWNAAGRHWRKSRYRVIDPDHGTRDTAHAACCLMFYDWMIRHDKGKDSQATPEQLVKSYRRKK